MTLLAGVYSKQDPLLVIALMSADKHRPSAYFALNVAFWFVTPEAANHFSYERGGVTWGWE